jgi:tetratricopeptide (TPR) repeat protein
MRMRNVWFAGAGCAVVGALVATVVVMHRAPAHAVAGSHADLRPTMAQLHYRYPLDTPDNENDDDATVAILVQRDHDHPASPFESAELADIYYRRAMKSGDRTAFETSERYAQKSLAVLRHPNGALATLAKDKAARHHFAEAIALAEESLSHKPTVGAYLTVATAHLALGELPPAATAAEAAIALKPDSSGYTTRALVEEAQGRDREAAADFVRAVAVEQPGLDGAAKLRALWARLLIRRGEYSGAAMIIGEALRISPQQPLAMAMRGELRLRDGDPEGAANDFDTAFGASRQIRYLMDEARAETVRDGKPATALLDQIETMVRGELADDGFGHTLDLIETLVDRGRPADLAEAVSLGREEVKKRASLEVRYQLARALARTGRDAEADAQLQAALATGAHEAQLYELAAELAAKRGDTDLAATYTHDADDVDPVNTGWRKP